MKDGYPVMPRIPVATYRLQFNNRFRFADAKIIIRFLSDLGITDIYSSPYFKAVSGSIHGYDIVDHNTLNPEIGTEQEYDELIDELRKHGMGQILDIVPNHVGAGKENPWWIDLLENGPSSLYAPFFDIDWEPVKKELKNRILIPVLGNQYGTVLENQELSLVFDDGAFFVCYYDHKFPVRPQTYSLILRHGLDELEKTMPGDDPELSELLSIVTALDHLPPYTETDTEKIRERYREKEIIKRRLSNLYGRSSAMHSFINRNVLLFNGNCGVAESFDLLDRLLNEQAYRLSHWRVATEEINYRRFFDVNELAAIRMENPAVFGQVHQLIFRLIREGSVTGLRVDHPDGLYNPSEYFRWLQKNCFFHTRLGLIKGVANEPARPIIQDVNAKGEVESENSSLEQEILRQYDQLLLSNFDFKPFYIVGEKILTKGERMPDDWQIFSTTGYVFMNSVNGIFIQTGNAKAFDDIYSWFVKTESVFPDIVYEKKKLIMEVAMSSEINMLAHYLNEISEQNRHTRDFTLNSLTDAIREVIAFFPVYRTYITGSEVNERDRRYVEHAFAKAKRKNPAINESVFNFLRSVLLLEYPALLKDMEKKAWTDFAMRFQQITGPVMAKGVEDTAFYIYNRLVSLNDVGGSPDRFGTPIETFHGQNIERMKFWPHALITTSTHDTKRSEDARARINVLTEMPDIWKQCLMRWRRLNKRLKVLVDGQAAPDLNEEYLLYQTLISVWPLHDSDQDVYGNFRERIKGYIVKALREAKVNTSWINPNTVYEDATVLFIERILDRKPANQFLEDFKVFQGRIGHLGIFNSLSQTLLKIVSPGVPDFYQGSELWDFSLVDPDNRRPIDYGLRMRMLEDIRRRGTPSVLLARELVSDMESGRIKLYVIHRALTFRKQNRDLFEEGEYLTLDAVGNRADHVCLLARRIGKRRVIAAVPRFLMRLTAGEVSPLKENVWGDSAIVVPFADADARYYNVFTGETVVAEEREATTVLPLSAVFNEFPVALLQRIV